ncbi:protein-glutamine gamma-glutamyltransferase K-like isoform X1 [Lampetra planeri]
MWEDFGDFRAEAEGSGARKGKTAAPRSFAPIDTVLTAVEDTGSSSSEVAGGRPRTTGPPGAGGVPLLGVWAVELHGEQEGRTRLEHRTERYETPLPVLRRGLPFPVTVTFSRPFEPRSDRLQLELYIGKYPRIDRGTYIPIPLAEPGEEVEPGTWKATVTGSQGARMALLVHTSPKCIVGKYRFHVATLSAGGLYRSSRDPNTDLYFLFNPWCPEDGVYMESEAEREEYVLNDIGRIFHGTRDQIVSRVWNFGQYEYGVLDAALSVLDCGRLPLPGRDSPVTVARVASAAVNSQDDNGVVEGCWVDNYTGGVAPTAWNGSAEILLDFKMSRRPVKYGQCWVFAGVATSVLRCLGIPSRPVTNYCSAHDRDASMSYDVYLDESLAPRDDLNKDSIWNYHVWSECWMARPDLPLGYGGWQIVDATPQENSEGIFRCGPSPVNAVKSGIVYLPYDTKFVFAEVNSDKVYWKVGLDGELSPVDVERRAVGHCISTKAIGSDNREDITHAYKYPEGSDEERVSVEMACRYGTKPSLLAEALGSRPNHDVVLEVTAPPDGALTMGRDVALGVRLKNHSVDGEERRVSLLLHCDALFYTGVVRSAVKRQRFDVDLPPGAEHQVVLQVRRGEYLGMLVDQGGLMLTATGRVLETSQPLVAQRAFHLTLTPLHIAVLGEVRSGWDFMAEVSFTNPLPAVLQGVTFRLEATGLQQNKVIRHGDIRKGETVTVRERLTPTRPGLRKLVGSMVCRQLTQVLGDTDLNVH